MKWKTRDVAYFTSDKSSSTIRGKIRCASCPWTHTVVSQNYFPAVDDAVAAHIREKHREFLRSSDIQKIPREDVREARGEDFGNADLIYFVLDNRQ